MTTARVEVPQKVAANFQQPATYRVFKGGRGSGKTRSLAIMAAIYVRNMAMHGKSGVFLCAREHLNSLDESSLQELKAAIQSIDWLAAFFDVGEKYIRTRCRSISFVFAGLRHNVDSIKSKARILGAWIDEAEPVADTSWQKLLPTIREEGAEIWISYNPESPDSATHRRFVATPPSGCVVTTINWRDNPWFPSILDQQRRDDQRLRPDVYDHIWEGAFLSMTEAQVFHGKFTIEEFEFMPNWGAPLQGVDFGFRPDPFAAVRCYVSGKSLYIPSEAYKPGIEIDATAEFIKRKIPGFEEYVTRADSAEPKTISYLQRNGLPRIEGVKKWPNSVIEGVRYLRGFEQIFIHPVCVGTARDFRLYSHKIDRNTGDILPDLLDANNHGPDAVRYALAPMIKSAGGGKVQFRL